MTNRVEVHRHRGEEATSNIARERRALPLYLGPIGPSIDFRVLLSMPLAGRCNFDSPYPVATITLLEATQCWIS